MVANIPFIFWCGAFLWAAYAMLDTLGLARPLTRWITANVWPGITLIVVVTDTFSIYRFRGDLGTLMENGLKSWDDARAFGLFVGGLAAPLIAAVGFWLAHARLKNAEQQTEIQIQDNLFTTISKSFESMESGETTKRILGLATLRQSAFSNYISLLEAAVSALISYCELRRYNTVGSDGPSMEPYKWDRPEKSEAFASIAYLTTLIRENKTSLIYKSQIRNVDFKSINTPRGGSLCNIEIDTCNFSQAQFLDLNLVGVAFSNCQMYRARFNNMTFNNSTLSGCEISEAMFFDCHHENFTNLLSTCKYLANKPPMVPVGTILPIPDVENPDMGIHRRRIEPAEARNWRDRRLVAIFDENDELIGMEYRGGNMPIQTSEPCLENPFTSAPSLEY